MDKHDTVYKELTATRKRNEELASEIEKLDYTFATEKRNYQEMLQKSKELTDQYNAIKQSLAWKFLKRSKKMASRSLQYLKGKRSWRQLFDSSMDKKRAKNRIKKLKYSLYEQGSTRKALLELTELAVSSDNKHLKKLAAWELALWNANQYNKEYAEKSLEFLSIVKKGEKDQGYLRRIAVIEAECLEVLGKADIGKQLINQTLENEQHIDLYFAAANLESSLSERMKWINKGLDMKGISTISLYDTDGVSSYDGLKSNKAGKSKVVQEAKVTVIIPVYNAAPVLQTSIGSILNQTWSNLEVIVVDDCSTDNTAVLVENYALQDPRVQLIKVEKNGGAYIARNLALKAATGDFVTINDADDWSHPEKIEHQVTHLIDNPSIVANTSQQARATEDLKFYRRGKPGEYVFANMSSLMFRRENVMKEVGYWDCVRFGADGEFKRRLKLVFGNDAVVDLNTGPYSFQRQSRTSLTGNEVFGFHGYFMGARKEYFDSYSFYHQIADSLRFDFPNNTRLFPVPEPMLPNRRKGDTVVKHFDVIIASEFRLLGGTNMSNVEEIKAQRDMGLRTGLVQMNRYDFHSEKQTNPKVRELIDGERVQMVVYGEKVSCDVLIVRHPPVLQEWQQYLPDIKAQTIKVIVNQPPKRDYSKDGRILYNITRCSGHLKEYFGKTGEWHPIGPLVRETLQQHHTDELKSIRMSSEDWVNIINISEWRREARPVPGSKIRIGRHSRSQYVKWPADKEELLTIYPESDKYEVHILGGAEAPKSILGYLPENWKVLEFGEVHPKAFLAKLDVFVYYTHPDWVEAFGRVIFEAMAVGVPVVIPPAYKELFGSAAIYAEPQDVQKKINELMNNNQLYDSQVQEAFKYIEEHFGYTKHASRLEEHFLDKNDYVYE